jgi:lysozyme family protein
MASVNFTQSLQEEYEELYNTCEVRENRFDDIDPIVDSILENQERYQTVAASIGAPWFFIAAIHNMESSRRFDRHLHNGDRLTARTVHVPAGRPIAGEPPFSWEESSQDALIMHGIDKIETWSLPRILYELEKFNGWGYRLYHTHVKSPYLWSFSNHYTSGKYVADGTWSDTAVSRQCGAAVIVRRLEERGEIEPLIYEMAEVPVLYYADEVIPYGKDLQRFLNTFNGISLRVDGWPGEHTSDAVKRVFGFRLNRDPRD